jgi:hypothetical protein
MAALHELSTAKDARSLGFYGPGAARRLVREAVDAYEKER